MKKLGNKAQQYKYYRLVHGIALAPSPEVQKTSTIPPSIYIVAYDEANGYFLYPKEVNFETILDLPGMPTQQIADSLDLFWKPETKAKYADMGLSYKRGILLHGKPGTGKTMCVIKVCEKFIKKGGIVIFNPQAAALSDIVAKIRDIQPDLKIMIVWEEFDEWKDDTTLLSLLDGELQTDSIVYIGTTNFLDKIPARIQNRPSRFAEKIEVKFPTLEDRKIYLSAKMKTLDKKTINMIAESTKGLVIDQVKDIVISTQIFGLSLREAIDKVKTYNLFEETETDVTGEVDELERKLRNSRYDEELEQMDLRKALAKRR